MYKWQKITSDTPTKKKYLLLSEQGRIFYGYIDKYYWNGREVYETPCPGSLSDVAITHYCDISELVKNISHD
jgi:hypothetical protein